MLKGAIRMVFTFNEHKEMFDALLPDIKLNKKYTVLDAGSGATSLNIITQAFKFSNIDAVCFPDDHREIHTIKSRVSRKNYTLLERDICVHTDWNRYDYVFAHFLLSEAAKSETGLMALLKGLTSIDGTHLVIIDNPEAPAVDFNRIVEYCHGAGYAAFKEHIVNLDKSLSGDRKPVAGRYYKGQIFKKIKANGTFA
jgi:hypothetical protein